MTYELVDGEVVTREGNGRVRWRGKPDGYPVRAVVRLPDSDVLSAHLRLA